MVVSFLQRVLLSNLWVWLACINISVNGILYLGQFRFNISNPFLELNTCIWQSYTSQSWAYIRTKLEAYAGLCPSEKHDFIIVIIVTKAHVLALPHAREALIQATFIVFYRQHHSFNPMTGCLLVTLWKHRIFSSQYLTVVLFMWVYHLLDRVLLFRIIL